MDTSQLQTGRLLPACPCLRHDTVVSIIVQSAPSETVQRGIFADLNHVYIALFIFRDSSQEEEYE